MSEFSTLASELKTTLRNQSVIAQTTLAVALNRPSTSAAEMTTDASMSAWRLIQKENPPLRVSLGLPSANENNARAGDEDAMDLDPPPPPPIQQPHVEQDDIILEPKLVDQYAHQAMKRLDDALRPYLHNTATILSLIQSAFYIAGVHVGYSVNADLFRNLLRAERHALAPHYVSDSLTKTCNKLYLPPSAPLLSSFSPQVHLWIWYGQHPSAESTARCHLGVYGTQGDVSLHRYGPFDAWPEYAGSGR